MPNFLGYPLSVPTIDYIGNFATKYPGVTPTVGMRIMTTATVASGANLVTPNAEWVYVTFSGGTSGWVPVAGTSLLQAIQQTAQTGLTDGAYVAMSYTATGMGNPFKVWDSAVGTTRFTAPWQGVYQFAGGVGWATTGTQHWTAWRLDGTSSFTVGSLVQGLTALSVPNRMWTYRLNAGQYIEQMAMCASGGVWATNATSGYGPNIAVTYQGVGTAAA